MFINKFFDRLTIGGRISSLQILACLCVLAVVGTSYFTLSRYKSVTQEADASLQHIGKIRDYQTRLLKLDQIVEFFLVARGDDTVGKIDNALAVLQSSVEEEYQEEIRLLGETTNKLRDLRIELGLSEKEGLEGALRAAVHSVEKGLESAEQEELSAGSLDPVRVKMLMLRRHEKDFIMRGQQKYVERFNKRVDEFGVRLANTKLKPATKSAISEDMKAYQTAFLAWAETYSELRQTAETFRKLSIQTLEHEEKTIQADTLHYQELETARQDVLASMLPINFGVSGLLLALYLLFGSLAVRGIKKPLRAISDALDRLSEGEEGVNIPEYKTEDEVGSLSDAATRFQMMVSNNKEIGRQQQEEANARAERAEQLDGLIGDLNTKLAGALEGVSGAMANASSQVGEVDSATFNTTTSAEKVNEAMKEASSRLLLMSSATTQLSQSSGEISIQMEEAFKVVNQASTQAHETSERITALVEATDKITSIVDLIQDIAERTNLLALNATIEAARAGEAGRGFSVVAHEVKQLASQTASATSEILSQVTEIQRETGNASSSVQTIAEFVSKIEMATQTVSSSIQQQDAATAEIASNVEDVNSKVETIEAAVKGINSSANDSTQSISTLKNSCNQVEDQLGTLETDIKAFLGSVQAA